MLRTLRAKLLAFFLLTTLLPLLFVGYISYLSQQQEITKRIEQSLLDRSDSIANEVETLLSERRSDVRHLATNPVLMDVNATKAEVKEQLNYFLTEYPIYSDVVYVNLDGIAFTSMIDKVVGTNLSDREWFLASKEGNIFISDIYYSPILEAPALVMSAPVLNKSGEIIGVISPVFSLKHLWETFNNFSKQEQMIDLEGYAFLINKNGDLIAHPEYNKILSENYFHHNNTDAQRVIEKSQNRTIKYKDELGIVLSYAQVEKMNGFEKDWFIGISVSKEALFAPLKKLLTNYIIIIAVVLFITSAAVFKLSSYIVKPVERLAAATSEFTVGKSIPPLINNSYEEINRLNQTFTSMTSRLIERERSDKKATLILETTDNAVFAINKQTRKITMFNRTSEQLFNLTKDYVINNHVEEVMYQSGELERFITSSGILEFLNKEVTHKFELEFRNEDKVSYFFINVSSLPSLENSDVPEELLIIINDLTDKRRMEQELIRSEKLSIVGEMAAGLAHEIRNPLAIIRGFIQIFDEEEKKEKNNYYKIIINEIDRVNHFINDLLNIANPNSEGNIKNTNILHLLSDLLTLQSSQMIKKGIKLKKQFEEMPIVFVDQSKLKQVCINIIQNAIEAMMDGGTLTVTTNYLNDEQQVKIKIQDTGIGMGDKTFKKLGTPFYTTKENGTGLGLTNSFRIIEDMGGSLEILSELGKGSSFTIMLPVVTKPKSFNL